MIPAEMIVELQRIRDQANSTYQKAARDLDRLRDELPKLAQIVSHYDGVLANLAGNSDLSPHLLPDSNNMDMSSNIASGSPVCTTSAGRVLVSTITV